MTPLSGQRVALVGGAGFIGHHLALALSRLGAEVAVIDALRVNNLLAFASATSQTPHRDLYLRILNQRLDLLRAAGVDLFTQDAREGRALRNIMRHFEPTAVVHLAGVAHADRSNRAPHEAFQHTLTTLENTLDAVRGGVEHLVFFSSSMVYGNFKTGSVTEETPCDPVGIYGALKYSGERLVLAHHQVFDVPYTIVRPSALYGERCVSRRVGQVFIESALNGDPLVVAGDGEDRLDFTYIHDLIDGILGILTSEAALNQTFNLTYGHSRSINDLLDLIRADFPDVEVRHEPRSALMPRRGTLCIDKARALIGYEPQYPLECGIARYVQWYRSMGLTPARSWTVESIEGMAPAQVPFTFHTT